MSGEIDLAGRGGNGSPNPDETAPARSGGGGGGNGNGSSITEMTRRQLFERVEKKEEQILKIEATVFQVANYNLVFQGVILAAMTNRSTALRCSLFWLPLSLSAIGSVLNFGILWMNAAKYKDALEELDNRHLALYKNKHRPNSRTDDMENSHRQNEKSRQLILVLSVILFCIFTALNLSAAWMIPCRSAS